MLSLPFKSGWKRLNKEILNRKRFKTLEVKAISNELNPTAYGGDFYPTPP